MELINNQYRVIRSMDHSEHMSSYLVRDLLDRNRKKIATIIDGEGIELSDFYIGEYAVLKNLVSPYILRNYDIELVKKIGEKRNTHLEYCILTEFLNDSDSLYNMVEEIPRESVLDIFSQACKAVCYSHKKNIIYQYINFTNIVISKNSGNYTLKLRDFATVNLLTTLSLLKKTQIDNEPNNTYFKAPEVIYEDNVSTSADIYSLGVLLFCLVANKKDVSRNFKADFGQYKTDSNDEYSLNMISIIEKATSDISVRYESVLELLADINSIFGTDFKAFELSEFEHMNFGARLIGRDHEMVATMENLDRIIAGTADKRYISIHGEHGIGKTALLNALKNKLYLQNVNIFWAFNCEKDGAMRTILKQLVEAYDYGENESDFIKYIISVVNGISDEKIEYDKKAIIKFIYDCVKDKPVVFIIDDMEKADEFSIGIFEKLMVVCKKLSLVFSYYNNFHSNGFLELLTRIKEDLALDIDLPALTIDDTIVFIKQALSLPNMPVRLADSIYRNTCGNPLFMEETLKSLQMNRILYVRAKDGEWHIDYAPAEYDKIPIPESIEQAVREQAEKIDEKRYYILEVLSIFYNIDITTTMIQSFYPFILEEVSKELNALVQSGILYRDASKPDERYGFNNKILKNYIYEKMDVQKLYDMHTRAAECLIKYKKLSSDSMDEIMYHFEKSGQNERLLEYAIKNAKECAKLRDFSKAAENYKKAWELCHLSSNKDKKVDILLSLVDILIKDQKIALALNYLLLAEDLVQSLEDIEKQITLSLSYITYYISRMEVDKANVYIEQVGALFEVESRRTAYEGLYMRYLLALQNILKFAGYNDRYYETVQYALNVCSSGNSNFQTDFTNNLGIYYNFNAKYDQALACYREALSLLEHSKNVTLRMQIMNQMAISYAQMSNFKMVAIIYGEMLANPCDPYLTAIVLNNLGTMYFDPMLDIDKATDNYKASLDSSILVELIPMVFINHLNQASINTEADHYNEAYIHLQAGRKMLDEKQALREDRVYFFHASSMFYAKIGDADKVSNCIEKAFALASDNKFFDKFKNALLILKESEKVFQLCDTSKPLELGEKVIETYRKVKEYALAFGTRAFDLNKVYDFILILHQKNYLHYISDEILEDINKDLDLTDVSPYFSLKILYIKSLKEMGKEKLNLLLEVFYKASEQKRWFLLIFICRDLSEYYDDINSYRSLDYCARACEAVQNLLMEVPEEFRLKYIERHDLFAPFAKMFSTRQNKSESGTNMLTIMFNKDLFVDILADIRFKQSAREAYFSELPYNINNSYDVVKNIGDDPEKNLRLLATYLKAITWAFRCIIIIDDPENGFMAIASNDGNLKLPDDHSTLKRAKALGCDILITESYNNISDETNSLLDGGIKATMCIPIMLNDKVSSYIYIYSDSAFHNFNEESLSECKWFLCLINMNISLYIIKVSSTLDKLSGALNREYLEAALDYHIKKANAIGSIFSIIMIDLDKFKSINDTYGHQTGDLIIKTTGKIIRANLRKDTTFGRYGGEEFVIILDNTNGEDALKVADKLRITLEDAKMLGSKRPVTASMGVATYGVHDVTKAGLIEKADKALYICKEHGRNRCEIYNNSYEILAKSSNTSMGIISGNTMKDTLRMRMILEIIELIPIDMPFEEKIVAHLEKIKEIAEAETSLYFAVENGEIKCGYGKDMGKNVDEILYNKEIINSAIHGKKCVFSTEGGSNLARSVIAIPLLMDEIVLGVLYFSAFAGRRTYNNNDVYFANNLSDLTMMLI